MKTAKNEKAAPAPVFGGAAKKEKSSGDSVRGSLRGKGFQEQEAALKPKDGAAPDGKQAGPQPGPHSVAGLGAGKFILAVEGQNAHFLQRVRVNGAKADLPSDAAPAVLQTVEVDAKGPWSVSVDHKVPDGTKWAKDRPKGWSPSTHKEVSRGPDHLDIGTEDFKDKDFDDLVLSIIRAEEPSAAYLVEAESKIEGYQTSYDLVLGASSNGRLDVMLDYRIIEPAELVGMDKEALTAMAERLASMRSKLAGSVDHEAKRKQLEDQIAKWELAVQQARSGRPAAAAKPAPKKEVEAPKKD